MIKKFRFSLFFFFLILLTIGNYANAEIRLNSQTDTITEIVSTYLGESGNDYGYGIAVDKDGYIYVAGNFLVKLSPDMTTVEYYISFRGAWANGIAVDGNKRVYIVGATNNPNLSTPNALFPNYSGNVDGFLMIISPDGVIEYCSYLGGEKPDKATGVVVGKDGYIYVAGHTQSLYFPVLNAKFPNFSGNTDGWVMKFYPGGTALYFSTFLGGSDVDIVHAIAANLDGSACVTGWTSSDDFYVTDNSKYKGIEDVFIVKFSPDGAIVKYSILLGGISLEEARAIDVDEDGCVYITGFASYSDRGFPTTPDSYCPNHHPFWYDIFVAKIDSFGILKWSTFFGGDDFDYGFAIKVGADGVYVTGHTESSNLPITSGAFQEIYNGDGTLVDVILFKLSLDGKKNLYCSYFGGTEDDFSWAAAVNEVGDIIFTGYTESFRHDGFPITDGVVGPFHDGEPGEADTFATKFFLSRLASLTIFSTYGGTTNPAPQEKDAYNYTKGTQAQIEAIPDSGYEFTGWTGNVPSGHEKDNPITIAMDSDKSITANFKFKVVPPPDKPDNDKRCFIATAAYDSSLHPYVKILREFRDRYLVSNKFGQKLVNFYYKHSPSIADFIAKYKSLKVAVRIMLLPLIIFSYSALHFSLATSMLILSIFPILFFHQKRKKRKKAKARF